MFQNTLTNGSESLKGVLRKYLHSINSQLYVIVKLMNYLTIPDSVAKQKKNQHIIIYAAIRGEIIALIFF